MTLREAVSLAYKEINDMRAIGTPLGRCRLVKYNEYYDSVECSWDERMDESIGEILGGVRCNYKFDLLLEMVEFGQEFQVYSVGSVAIRVFFIDLETKELRIPVAIRLPINSTVLELKLTIKCKH